MNKLFGIELIEKNGYKIPRIYFLKISHKLKWMKLNLSFYWKDVFAKYFKENDMQSKISNLKEGLDEISQEYINHFMKLFPRIGKIYLGNIWTKDAAFSFDLKRWWSLCINMSVNLNNTIIIARLTKTPTIMLTLNTDSNFPNLSA